MTNMTLKHIISKHPNPPENDPRYDADAAYSLQTLPAGWSLSASSKALEEDLIFEKNVPIKLRDGITILTDIFRPVKQERDLPAILVWSPYGKTGRGKCSISAIAWLEAGILPSDLSGLEKFEGPDPARWCPQGYAIINIDPRGTYDSEGIQSPVPSRRMVQDAYDVVEWLAVQPWCNGKIGATGNSQLAMSQYFIGESQAPHLAALAPWEGLTDNYRATVNRGGIPDTEFAASIFGLLCGRDQFELLLDELTQPGQDGLYREHARNINASPSSIKVPLYVTASVGSVIHLHGSILAWKKAASVDKWLRLHGGQEWWDYYNHQDELQRFFDKYLKGIDNDWEQTPKVRYQLLPFGPLSSPKTLPYKTAADFPPKEMKEIKMYLGSTGSLSLGPEQTSGSVSYDSSDPNAVVSFAWKSDSNLGVIGLPRIKLYGSNDTQDDFDIYITLRKLDKNGQILFQYCWPLEDLQAVAKAQGKPIPASHEDYPALNTAVYIGPNGRIRASHRKSRAPRSGDEEDNLSWPGWPFHPHDEQQPVPTGTIVEIETGIWPANIEISEGEGIRLDLTPVKKEFFDFPWQLKGKINSSQKGKQSFYFGGRFDAHLILPTIQL